MRERRNCGLRGLKEYLKMSIRFSIESAYKRDIPGFLGDIPHIYLDLTARIKAFEEVLNWIEKEEKLEKK